MHRMREARVKERTAPCNQTRGVLAEYGIVVAQGVGALRRRVPEVLEDAENGLSDFLRPLLSRCYEQMCELDAHIEFYTRAVHEHARRDEAVKRLQTVPGFGPVVASVFHAFVGDGGEFMCRRRWAWCPSNIAAGGRRCASASAETGTCAACWCMEAFRSSNVRRSARTGSAVGRPGSRPRAGRTRRRWRWRQMARIGWAVVRSTRRTARFGAVGATVLHPLPTAAPVFEARAAVDKGWRTVAAATITVDSTVAVDPTGARGDRPTMRRQCGHHRSDRRIATLANPKAAPDADRSIRTIRGISSRPEGRRPSSTAGYTTNPVPVTLKQGLPIREETIYGLAQRNPTWNVDRTVVWMSGYCARRSLVKGEGHVKGQTCWKPSTRPSR